MRHLLVIGVLLFAACSPTAENGQSTPDAAEDVATDTGDTTTPDTSQPDTAVDTKTPPKSGPIVYIVIHVDPTGTQPPTTYEQDWEKFLAFMAEIDGRKKGGHDHHLTLLFAPNWGPFILADEGRVDVVAGWVKDGHELGFHHHTAIHPIPDGFADLPEDRNDDLCCLYQGTDCNISNCTMKDAVSLVEQMITDPRIGGVMRTINGGQLADKKSGKTYYSEYTDSFVLATSGYAEAKGGAWWEDAAGNTDLSKILVSETCLTTETYPNINPAGVRALQHNVYGEGKPHAFSLKAITDGMDGGGAEDYLGVVFHHHTYSDNAAAIQALLTAMDDRNLHSKTVYELLGDTVGCTP
jgi:hypothetical protein